RCNATSLCYVRESRVGAFAEILREEASAFVPGSPLDESTKMGPVISATAVDRYRTLSARNLGEFLTPAETPATVGGKRGHWAAPAVLICRDFERLKESPLFREESFCPLLTIVPFRDDVDAIAMHNAS